MPVWWREGTPTVRERTGERPIGNREAWETQGLLGRRLDPTDNRYNLAALTPIGEQTAADLERAHEQYQQRLLDGVTARQRQIVLDVLERIRANTTELENS